MLFRKQRPPARIAGQGAAQGTFRISREGKAAIDEEGIVLFHLSTGVIFRANRIGSRIWQGLAGGLTPKMIAAALSSEYGVPVERVEQDAAAFIADLKAHRFLIEAEGSGYAIA